MLSVSELSYIVSSNHGKFALVYCSDFSSRFGLIIDHKLARRFFDSLDEDEISMEDLGISSENMLFLFTPDSEFISVPYDQVSRIMTFTGSCIDHCNQMYLEPNDYLNEFKLIMSI